MVRTYTARELAEATGLGYDAARALIVANRGTEHVTRVRRPIGSGATREVEAWVHRTDEADAGDCDGAGAMAA